MKAFIAYKLNDGFNQIDDGLLKDWEAVEPVGTQWKEIGLKPHPTLFADEVQSGLFASRVSHNEQAITVSIIERILPSATIKRHLTQLRDDFEQQHGQKVTKQQMAEWKEHYIADTLPDCPLKETLIEVSFDYKNRVMLVGTSSQKNADTVVSWLVQEVFTDKSLQPTIWRPHNVGKWLHNYLENDTLLNASAKLFNMETEEKSSFANDVGCQTAQRLFKEKGNMRVTELGLRIDDYCAFTLTDKAVVKGIKYAMSAEQEMELNEAKGESATRYHLTNQTLMVAARRQILEVFKEMENEPDEL